MIESNQEFRTPKIGFGTASTDTEAYGEMENAVKEAIEIGYRYFDTSNLYGNEIEVGNAIKQKTDANAINRSDIFVTNKFCCTNDDRVVLEESCRKSLKRMSLDYFDMYLLHIPSKCVFKGEELSFPMYSEPKLEMRDTDYVLAWKSMEYLLNIGLTKNIGVANCTIPQLERILNEATILPKIVHIDCCPGLHQKKLIKFCKDRNIIVTAYCPLNRPDFREFAKSYNNHPDVLNICRKYQKTSSQVILRYLHQLGTIPVPKSITLHRIAQYIEIFNFKLSDMEMNVIDSFYVDERAIDLEQGLNPLQFPLMRKKIPVTSKCRF